MNGDESSRRIGDIFHAAIARAAIDYVEARAPMPAGTRFGAYEIVGLIGSGGMGEVYRARDSKLGRDVAIKLLPDAFAADRDRRARFDREARALAALNHPHIAAIYGAEDVGPRRGLVLELVDGQTLADRLRSGPIPLTEALAIARQIAQALDAAHARGIVHRDLKPANIKISASGAVKVLDFGLAKLAGPPISAPDLSKSPTVVAPGTSVGAVLGTAGYMSPEQARGQEVDARADVWAFGCVLFEMLTGRSAFAGSTTSDTIAAVLTAEADWTSLPRHTPSQVRELLRHCLERDRTRRIHAMADARLVLDGILPGGATRELVSIGSTAPEFLSLSKARVAGQALSVSPDGRWVVFGLTEQNGGDIMLVENFR